MIRSIPSGRIVAVLLAGLVAAASCSSGRPGPGGAVYGRAATLVGPVTTGQISEPVSASAVRLPAGWVEQEFFASGRAYAFNATSTPSDGRWNVVPTTSAPYRTRIIVRRPTDSHHFNGTVVVEWMNVSSGESSPDWTYLNPLLTEGGYAYVAVSAQELGVQGGTPILGSHTGGLVGSEPARYGSLHHPGDRYSYDMFAQIARALRLGGRTAALGPLRARHIVAVGESQSAFFLTTFADAVQPRTGSFDGIFIHSRGGSGAPLDGGSIVSGSTAAGQRIRTDLGVPVFMFETETDVTLLGYSSARQPDTDRIRTWEVAGTSHADSYIVGGFAQSLGCTAPVNDGPQHVVVQAAFAAFERWVADGVAPPEGAPLRLVPGGPARLALDGNGNALGGVRTPAVDVPVSTLSGTAPPGASLLCSLFGSTTAFDPGRLARLYGTEHEYRSRYARSLDEAIAGGYILPSDRAGLLQEAAAVRFP